MSVSRGTLHFMTADEVGERVKKSGRWVREKARELGIGRKFGRDWLFTEEDIRELDRAMKSRSHLPKCKVSSISIAGPSE